MTPHEALDKALTEDINKMIDNGRIMITPKFDPVSKPAHYNFGAFEVIDVIEDWKLGYHLGNVVKYVARAKHKGRLLEDLKKARWYLDRAIQKNEAELEGLRATAGTTNGR